MIIIGEDGKTHINIYSKGKTELGRFLSNFAYCQVITPDGLFSSIEGYWYWLSTGHEHLRKLHGYSAKKFGKSLPRQKTDIVKFWRAIETACWNKIHSQPYQLGLFKQSTLPFAHYYEYSGHRKDAGHDWLVNMWEVFRTHIKNNYK
jgi:hypothetical protein